MIKFGTDGWRAVIAEDFTFENVKIVSQAIADYLKKTKRGKKRVVVGYDRRFLSADFAKASSLVLAANGISTVLSSSDVPTPAVSFHCDRYNCDLGIIITASHNPSQFNGLKIKTSEGGSADQSLTDAVERLLGATVPKQISCQQAQKKKLFKVADLTRDYTSFFKGFVDLKKIRPLRLKVLVDTMYGSGNSYIESILSPSKIKINYLHNEYNPSFGGIHPEPVESNLQELISQMKRGRYDIGLVLDGDADRIALVDAKGNYVNAQVILPLLAIHMIKNRKIRGGIGKTVVGSDVIDKVALSLGVACYETPVGFKYLSDLFKKNLIAIGGEEAGGIGFKGYIPERDGSCAFLLLLEMLAYEKKDFTALIRSFYYQFGRYYYSRTAVPVKSLKKNLADMRMPKVLHGKPVERINTLDGIKIVAKDCWLMFRKSGTEPIVRVYAESTSRKEAGNLIALGKRMIRSLQ